MTAHPASKRSKRVLEALDALMDYIAVHVYELALLILAASTLVVAAETWNAVQRLLEAMGGK